MAASWPRRPFSFHAASPSRYTSCDMLAPRVIIFTTANLLGSPTRTGYPASEALAEIERRKIPLVLLTRGTRAQLEILRRKIGHAHPFVTEGGGGLFLPDGYFALGLEAPGRGG